MARSQRIAHAEGGQTRNVRIDSERTRWYFGRVHLREIGDSCHECIALLVSRFGVDETLEIDRLTGPLLTCKLPKRPLEPKLVPVKTKHQLFATLNGAK